MPRTISVHFLPLLTSPEELAGGTVVVIDVLRASTTIAAALAAGAREIIPCLEIDEAKETAAKLGGRPNVLLAGERKGGKIDGFDLASSPSEFSPDAVGGRTLVFTTTNGTKAMGICRAARRILVGSFVTYSSVLRELIDQSPIHLLCAGTNGRITREDVLFAGALAEAICSADPKIQYTDQVQLARDAWQNALGEARPPKPADGKRLSQQLRNTQGGRNVIGLGLEPDIDFAATIDRYDFAPLLEIARWRIVRPPSAS
jgi:2-phosphosulfolactate phosphatase